MNGVDVIQAFGRKGLFEVFFADPVNSMTGERLPSLVDKESVLVQRLRRDTVLSDIELEKMTSFCLDLYNPEPIPFSKDHHCFVLGVKVVEIQRGHFGGPGPGIIE